MDRPTVVIIYCRVSTDEQEDNTSLEQQEIDGREYCDQHGFSTTVPLSQEYPL